MAIDFRRIKSLFIVEDETADKKTAQAGTASAGGGEPSVEKPESGSTAARSGQVSPQFMQVLFDAMEKANLPGMDYLEYKQSLKSLEKMPMEEAMRYQSAFAVAQAMGATSQKLIESANHYLDVLKGEEAKFGQALIKQTRERIGNRQQTLDNLESVIRQKTEQIKKLNEEIEQHQQEMDALRDEIKEATMRVEVTKNDFTASYETLTTKIEADVERMKKYLK